LLAPLWVPGIMTQTVIVSFKAPLELVEKLDSLVEAGVFRNRSEALRYALVLLVTRYRVEKGEAGRGGAGGPAEA